MSAAAISALLGRILMETDGGPGMESVVFTTGGEEELARAVDGFHDSDELKEIVLRLIEAMYILEIQGGCVTAAKQIARIIERESTLRALAMLETRKAADSAQARGQDLRRFADVRTNNSAPRHDARAPEGTLKLNSMAIPRRLS